MCTCGGGDRVGGGGARRDVCGGIFRVEYWQSGGSEQGVVEIDYQYLSWKMPPQSIQLMLVAQTKF